MEAGTTKLMRQMPLSVLLEENVLASPNDIDMLWNELDDLRVNNQLGGSILPCIGDSDDDSDDHLPEEAVNFVEVCESDTGK